MDKGRYRSVLTAGIVVVALVASVAAGSIASSDVTRADAGSVAPMHHHLEARALTPAASAFHDAMRKLWEDHVTWTRLFIVSFASDLPDLAPTTQRLLKNQVDIGRAVRPFYGRAAANHLTHLLTVHITTAASLLQAAKDGDAVAFKEAKHAWYANARQIAGFLHSANPKIWPLRDLRSMMREHLDLTLAEAAHRLAGQYQKDVADYDAVHIEILEMADMLSDGIIRQFPGRFSYAG
jgi:hypothetical protein